MGQAILAGERDSAKMALASADTSKVEGKYKNGASQHLHPWREFQKTPAPLADTFTLVNESLSHIV